MVRWPATFWNAVLKKHSFAADHHQPPGPTLQRARSPGALAPSGHDVLDAMLVHLLQCTQSDCAFVADVCRDPVDQHRFLRVTAFTDTGHPHADDPIEFHRPDTLFDAVVKTGRVVICNDPANDIRSRGCLPEYRPTQSFLGVPLLHGGELVGILALSDREGGYDPTIVALFDPLFASVGAIVGAVRVEAERNEAMAALRESRLALGAAAVAAQRMNAARTDFLTRMSHELHLSLNSVLGFAQLLQMHAVDTLTPLQADRVGHIQHAGEHLLAMASDVLDLSTIERGSLPFSMEAVSVSRIVEEAVTLATAVANERQVFLRIEPPVDQHRDWQARGDYLRLRQVMANLMSNAIKYSRPGGTVTVTWRMSQDGTQLQLDVRDTGRGMSPVQLAHLFEPFNRLGVRSATPRGPGIKLTVSQRLMQRMGGEIEVSSEEGVGSCFRVVLPAVPCDEKSVPANVECSHGDKLSSPGARCPVLYADENVVSVEIALATRRSRPDLRAVIAHDGREAIKAARRERPDLLLLDIHLGDMTGIDVKQTLERDPAMSLIPSIAVSA